MSFPALKIGDLTAKIPVVQGGMGVGISLSGLASAVANQGGIGVIAGASPSVGRGADVDRPACGPIGAIWARSAPATSP